MPDEPTCLIVSRGRDVRDKKWTARIAPEKLRPLPLVATGEVAPADTGRENPKRVAWLWKRIAGWQS